jgi:hypothetical protein
MHKFSLQARQRCATFLPGASNTTSEAVHLPVSEVFSCPKFKILDVGRAYRKDGRTASEVLLDPTSIRLI